MNKKINQCTEKSSLNNHTPTKYIAVHFAVAITANAVLACVRNRSAYGGGGHKPMTMPAAAAAGTVRG